MEKVSTIKSDAVSDEKELKKKKNAQLIDENKSIDKNSIIYKWFNLDKMTFFFFLKQVKKF